MSIYLYSKLNVLPPSGMNSLLIVHKHIIVNYLSAQKECEIVHMNSHGEKGHNGIIFIDK